MGGDDYVIDEKRGKAWGNPWDALKWYRAELDRAEAEIEQIREDCESSRPVP